jgi:1,2-diacylglycerol 3-alpha-glucosyltransferase
MTNTLPQLKVIKPTILLTSNAYLPNIGGVENSLRYLAHSYQALGFNVVVLVSDVAQSGQALAAKEVIDGVTIFRYSSYAHRQGLLKIFRPFSSARHALALLKQLKREHQIVLTISRFHTSTLLASLADMPNLVYLVPGVVKQQNQSQNLVQRSGLAKLKQNLSRSLHHAIQVLAFKRCNQVLVFSENMAKQVTAIVPKLAPLPIVKPGVDTTRFSPIALPAKNALRNQYKLPIDKVILLAVGRLVRAKGFDLMIEAMQSLPECHLVIVGDGENQEQIKHQIIELNLANKVSLMGSQPDSAPFYQLADLFIMSSRYEPLGQTILEALAAALPVVAFHSSQVVTATNELLAEHEAIYCSKVSAPALAATLSKLCENPDDLQRYGAQSRIIAETKFAWSTLAKQLLSYSDHENSHSQ